jgi:Transposase DNA-binding/Transposase DDE domain
MNTQEILVPERWAKKTFGPSKLKDIRRTERAVKAATRMAENASASLPAQMQTWKEVLALYRLLDEPDVTFEALMQPHWQQTRQQLQAHPVVLLIQDGTELDLSSHHQMTGLGPIGKGTTSGLLLQTVLAIEPVGRKVLGCAMQEAFVRTPIPTGETRSKRRQRAERETDVWMRLVKRLGSFSTETVTVHVGDRGADMFGFFEACQSTRTHFLVRAAHNRRIESEEEAQKYLLSQLRSWQPSDSRLFEVPASHGRKARVTTVQLAFGQVTLLPPRLEKRYGPDPLPLWAIRVWEEQPPPGEEPLEWLLLTSVPTETLAQAWEHVGWYECRWVVEDYHQALKTGCRIEERLMHTAERLIRLLGLLSPVAVRLLQLRDLARSEPDQLACKRIEADLLTVVAIQAQLDPGSMTVEVFWKEVARLGGYLARRRDGPPGWKTLWAGWLRVQTLLEGFHLASHLLL